MSKKQETSKRFFDKMNKTDTCWIWTGYLYPNKYGYFRLNSHTSIMAHRYSWQLHCGDIPENMLVCHHCDNPSCVNPNHLFLGTDADNSADMVKKGRSMKGEKHRSKLYPNLTPRGEESKLSKLTEVQVLEIRQLTNIPQSQIAKKYNVSQTLVSKILLRKLWTHI